MYLYILCTGLLFYTYSERFFWSFWRTPDDTIKNTIIGILLYSIAAYAFLFLIEKYNIKTKEGLFTVAFLYAFIIEGMIAGMLYSPFPLMLLVATIAVPWHIFVTIFLGWHYIPRLLQEQSSFKKYVTLMTLGVFWCIWSLGWFTLPGGNLYTAENYVLHALGTTVLALIAYYSITKLGKLYQPQYGAVEGWSIATLLLLLLIGLHFQTLPYSLPLSLIVVATTRYILKKQNTHKTDTLTIKFPSTTYSYTSIFILSGAAILCMLFLFNLHIRAQTAYIFAVPFSIYTCIWILRSTKTAST